MTANRRGVALRVLAVLLPHGERDEVVDDVAAEHAERRRGGRLAADVWLWRQVLLSIPALLRRSWWRGWSGFEPEANRMRTGGPMLETWIMDARYAVRRLVHRPTYALLAVLTLALGVGGTAAIFGIVRELLLAPLPIDREEQVAVWWMAQNWSEAELLHLRGAGTPGFDAVSAYGASDVRLASDGVTLVIPALHSSAELFDVLGVRPRFGAGFVPGDDAYGAEPKLVLSHGLWLDLGGDPGIIGEQLTVNGVQRTVVGVMEPGFWFPDPDTRMWIAHGFQPQVRSGWLTMIGRLTAGQTSGEVATALGRIGTSLGDQFEYSPAWDNSANPELTPVREAILGPVRPTLVATLTAMAVILLMACANVAALMLGQMEGRTTELSVRSALGAGRGRLTQQLLAEGVAVGVAAGVAGAAFAAVSFRLLLGALPLGALAERATLDWAVFSFALLLAIGAALAIALIPVFALLRAELSGALQQSRTGGIVGRGGRMESGLVVAEVALAVMIAAGAALLIRSVANLRAIDTGLDAATVAVVDVVLPAEAGDDGRGRLIRDMVAELGALAGVESAAAVQRLALRAPRGDNWGLSIEGRPEVTGVTTSFRIVTHDYLPALGVRLRSGRLFDAGDAAGTDRVVVINESLAREYFPGEDPIGRRVGDPNWARVVGVVADLKEGALTDEPHPARYVLYDQIDYAPTSNTLVLRMRPGLDPTAVLEPARRAIQRVAPGTGIQDATTMNRIAERALGPAKQLMSLLSLLSGLALLLGGIGVYGVVSHSVNRRRRDWGIRMALGFRPRQVIGHIVGRGALLVSGGIAAGIIGALVLGRLLTAFVYGIETADPGALAAAALVLFGIGIIGAYVPARRASRVDPARVLREQ